MDPLLFDTDVITVAFLNNSLLIVLRRYICYGSLLPVFGGGVSLTFHFIKYKTFVHFILSSFGLLSGHLLGKSCSLGWPCVLFVL